MKNVWEIKRSTRSAYARNGNLGNASVYVSWLVYKNGRFNMRFRTRREAKSYISTKAQS